MAEALTVLGAMLQDAGPLPPELEVRLRRPLDDVDDVSVVRIFRAILVQASLHALGRPYLDQWPTGEDRRGARAWFERADDGFVLTCRAAGYAPALIRRVLLGTLDRQERE